MKIIRWLNDHLEEYVLSGLLVVIASVMMLQVIMRYVFNNSLSWAEEASRYAFIWSALISIGYSIKERNILRVDTLIEALPRPLRNLMTNLGNLTVVAFFGYLSISAVPAVQRVMRSSQTSPALKVHMGWIYLAAILGFFLATFRAVQRLRADFKDSSGKAEL